MTSQRRLTNTLFACAVVLAICNVVLVATSQGIDATSARGWLGILIEWALIVIGIATAAMRPTTLVGPIVATVGFALAVTPLLGVESVPVQGVMISTIGVAVFIHVFISYPSFHLESDDDRFFVSSAYAATLLIPIPAILFVGSGTDLAGVFAVAALVQLVVSLAVMAMLVRWMARKWSSASQIQRMGLAPVLWGFVGGAGVFCVRIVFEVVGASAQLLKLTDFGFSVATSWIVVAMLFGHLRLRSSHADAVGALVEKLTQEERFTTGVRDALAETLQDPTLEFAFWLPNRQQYVDADGHPVALPGPESGRLTQLVERDGEPIASIIFDEAISDQSELVRTAGNAAALVLENERLDAELRARVDELQHSRARLVEASDVERKRIERNLHDGAQQHLVSLALSLAMAQSKLQSRPDEAAELIEQSINDLAQATDDLHELASGIHPVILSERGLAAAIETLADRAPIAVKLTGVPEARLPNQIESTLYFVVAEALTNVAKYSEATGAVVRFVETEAAVIVEIQDDGIGGADARSGTGLRGLGDRVAALDGELSVDSKPGEGTTIRAAIRREDASSQAGVRSPDEPAGHRILTGHEVR
ncbi:MAG: sensor histidine kinase [Solirubrobacterales bacterium]